MGRVMGTCRGSECCRQSPGGESTAEQIVRLERELLALRHEQDVGFVRAITSIIGTAVAFSARELFEHRMVSPALQAVFDDAGVSSVKQLGKRLRRLRGQGIAPLGRDNGGSIWVVQTPNDLHEPSC